MFHTIKKCITGLFVFVTVMMFSAIPAFAFNPYTGDESTKMVTIMTILLLVSVVAIVVVVILSAAKKKKKK